MGDKAENFLSMLFIQSLKPHFLHAAIGKAEAACKKHGHFLN